MLQLKGQLEKFVQQWALVLSECYENKKEKHSSEKNDTLNTPRMISLIDTKLGTLTPRVLIVNTMPISTKKKEVQEKRHRLLFMVNLILS